MTPLEQSVMMMELALKSLPEDVYGFFVITDSSGMRKMGSTMAREHVLNISKEFVEMAQYREVVNTMAKEEPKPIDPLFPSEPE